MYINGYVRVKPEYAMGFLSSDKEYIWAGNANGKCIIVDPENDKIYDIFPQKITFVRPFEDPRKNLMMVSVDFSVREKFFLSNKSYPVVGWEGNYLVIATDFQTYKIFPSKVLFDKMISTGYNEQ